jgi:hypothetical protein
MSTPKVSPHFAGRRGQINKTLKDTNPKDMKVEELKDVVSEPKKGTPLQVVSEVLKVYKEFLIKQRKRPSVFESVEARRQYVAKAKAMHYQYCNALFRSMVVLGISEDARKWYLNVLHEQVERVNADLSNCKEVASDILAVITLPEDK